MAYRIDYCEEKQNKRKEHIFQRMIWTMVFLSLFLICVSFFWPEGREVLQLLLIPGNPNITMEAAEVFVNELDSGSLFLESAESFIKQMIGYETIR